MISLSNFCKIMIIQISFFCITTSLSYASTTSDANSKCEYIDAKGDLRLSTTCIVNFGILSVEGGARYILTFPNKTQVIIYETDKGSTANGTPSQISHGGNGRVAVVTNNGEVFVFSTPLDN